MLSPVSCRRPSLIHRFLIVVWIVAGVCLPVSGQVELELAPGEIVDVVESPTWEGSFSAGMNGKSGNSQNLDINFALKLQRETESCTIDLLANYFYASNDVATTTDRWFSEFRRELKFSNPRFGWYYQSAVEVDRFKDFDYRIALHTGLSYKILDAENHHWKVRSGLGASREVDSANEDWSPELQFGTDWDRQLTESTRIYATVDYFPNVSDFADYRLNTNAGLDFLINEQYNWNFRLFAQNRYDSTPPPGNQKSDLDYGMAFVVGF